MTDIAYDTLALLAAEWFKAANRALRITEEAAPGRLERERARIAYSTRRIEDALAEHGLRIHTFDGQPYSPALPAEPVNPEDFTSEEGLVVRETIEPTIVCESQILLRGKIVLAKGA
jgi:hypothetical protein